MRSLWWGVLIAAILAASAVAGPDVVTNPDWRRRPTPENLMAVYPDAALKSGKGGRAVISCKVSVEGALYDCVVAREEPPGLGFGDAALALSTQLLMKPMTINGKPVGGAEVNIPIRWPDLLGLMPGGSIINRVPWLEAPTVADVVAAYPARARAAKTGGRATLNCSFGRNGLLGKCTVLGEDPAGMDFGRAAKSLVDRFIGPATFSDGKTTQGAETQLTFAFAPEMLSEGALVIGKPQWARAPEVSDMRASYPAAALQAKVESGRVALTCTVGRAGRLHDCSVESQSPEGMGFDQAALALSADFLVTVWTDEGLPTVGGRVRVPIHYVAPPPESAPAPAAAPRP